MHGCASSGEKHTDHSGAAAAAEPLTEQERKRQELGDAAEDLQALFDRLAQQDHRAEEPPDTPAPEYVEDRDLRANAIVEIEDDEARPLETSEAADTETDEPPGQADEPAEDPQAAAARRRIELVNELADMLLDEAARTHDPALHAMALAAMELIQPGAGQAEMDLLADQLSPPEAEVVRGFAEMIRRITADPVGAADPAVLAQLLREEANRLGSGLPLEITRAVLCRRVESFGRFTPLASTRLLAGRSHAAIVYVEVENFAQRRDTSEDADGERWVIDLGQELALYHDADGLLAWRRPEQALRDTSSRRRRDLYLVQRVDLPSTLTVGRYHLKVTVRDRATGAAAEAVIPIEIVADPALAGAGD